MSDMLQSGLSWMAGQLNDHASRMVTYVRGNLENAEVPATLGQSEFPKESQQGLTTQERTQDFLIKTSKLTLDNQAILPEPGDRIVVTGLGTFEVCSPGGNEPDWRYSDAHHLILRIHTREIRV